MRTVLPQGSPVLQQGGGTGQRCGKVLHRRPLDPRDQRIRGRAVHGGGCGGGCVGGSVTRGRSVLRFGLQRLRAQGLPLESAQRQGIDIAVHAGEQVPQQCGAQVGVVQVPRQEGEEGQRGRVRGQGQVRRFDRQSQRAQFRAQRDRGAAGPGDDRDVVERDSLIVVPAAHDRGDVP